MFNIFFPGTIEFCSNPPLPDEAFVVAVSDDDGKVRNSISFRPKSNKSPLDGLHFDEATDSLRARLNLGVPLKEVPLLNVQKDPLELMNKARKFVDSVMVDYDRLSSEINDAAAPVEPAAVVEPSK